MKDEDVSDQSDSKKIPFDYHSSEDPEWIEAPRKAKKKKAGPLSKINKMKQLAAHFSRKITIEFSDKSDVQSSVDDSCHFSTPPTSPEFTSPHVFSFPQQESESSQTSTKRRRTSCDLSDDDRDDNRDGDDDRDGDGDREGDEDEDRCAGEHNCGTVCGRIGPRPLPLPRPLPREG